MSAYVVAIGGAVLWLAVAILALVAHWTAKRDDERLRDWLRSVSR